MTRTQQRQLQTVLFDRAIADRELDSAGSVAGKQLEKNT